MSLLESLPIEILDGIIGYISRIEDLKSICLASKKLSTVSTPILYHDLIILDDYNNYKKMWQIVKEITKGKNLQYVRTLYVGMCTKKTTKELDKLLVALDDNSLYRFSYLSSTVSKFPKESQSRYICHHQKRICNLHSGDFFECILSYPPNIREDFLSSITELSILLSHSYQYMKFALPVWVMRIIKSYNLRKLEVFHNMTIFNLGFTSFFSIWHTSNLTHLSFVEYFFKDDEVDLTTMPNLTHLVFRNCYNILYGLYVNPETKLKSLELYNSNSNLEHEFNNDKYNFQNHYPQSLLHLLNNFQSLETIIIRVGIDDFTVQEREDLANAIQRHQETLKILIIEYKQKSFSMGLISHTDLINAIKTCKKLSQLCLEVESKYFFVKIKELIKSLPDLTLLYLVSMNIPESHPLADDLDLVAQNILETVPTSSKLSLLCFRMRLAYDNIMDDYVECFFRPKVRNTSGFEREAVTTITTKEALYRVRESSIIRKLEPWLFQQQEPSRWFEE